MSGYENGLSLKYDLLREPCRALSVLGNPCANCQHGFPSCLSLAQYVLCSVGIQRSLCYSGIASPVHWLLGQKHPKNTCVFVSFFTGREHQSLHFIKCISPFMFTYKKELTLIQKFALQNAQGSSLSEHGLLPASPGAPAHEASPTSRVTARHQASLHCTGRPCPPRVTLRTQAQSRHSLPRQIKAHTASC